jgi:ATP-dependent DNA ligase
MISAKRNFENFKEFPGTVSDQKYVFPSLYYKDSSAKTRIWTIQVRLVKDLGKKRPKYKHNWSLEQDKQIPIISGYLADDKLPSNVASQFWVETGIIGGKISRHPPTYPDKTNVDRANERNVFKQALAEARSKYLDKWNDGGRIKKEFEARKKIKTKIFKFTTYFPMLARKYEDEKKKVTWPALGQPKLDGVRCVAHLNANPELKSVTYKNVVLATRQKKKFQGFDHIRMLLLQPLIHMFHIDGHSLYVDGEFYKHGKALQDISGEVRSIERNSIVTKDSVQLHLFDCFYPTKLVTPFKERYAILEDFFMVYEVSDVDWSESKIDGYAQDKDMIQLVPCVTLKNEKDMMKKYKAWVAQKYEGLMYRKPDGPYLAHPTKTGTFLRSRGLLKMKMRYSDEFKVTGFTEGTKGRDKGAIMWICQTADGKKNFHVTPKNTTLKARYELFKKIQDDGNFDEEYKGKMMTVEYEDLSKAGVPLRAKAVGIRDYE